MKLTKKILEQLIKEEITLTQKAPFKLIPKDIYKQIDLELKPKAGFKLKPKKFSSFVKSLPVIGRTVGNLLDVPDLMRLDQVYEKQGAEAALKELGRFALGFAPGIGELMLISDLADKYQDKKLKATVNALYMPLRSDGAKISAEKGRPRLTPLRTPRVGVNPFKESKLKQIIKEELSLIEREILDPPPGMEVPERYESQVPEATKILDKILGVQTGIFSDPCLKKQTTKNNFKKLLSTLPKLSTKNLDYLENELAYYIEYEKEDLKAPDGYRYQDKLELQEAVDEYYEMEELINNISSGRIDLLSKEDQKVVELLINLDNDIQTPMDVIEFIRDGQERRIKDINRLKRKAKQDACKVRIYTRVYEAVSEINIQKAQAQSKKQKKGGGTITIYDKQGNIIGYQGVDQDGKIFSIKESNMKLTKSKLKQLIKEEISKLTEERKQYLCYQWWRDLEAEQPGRYKSLGREMRAAFDNVDNYDPTIAQMNAWLDRFSECPIDPSVVDIIDVDEPQ